jgi:hypothetical protein
MLACEPCRGSTESGECMAVVPLYPRAQFLRSSPSWRRAPRCRQRPRLNLLITAYVEVDGKPHAIFKRVLKYNEVRGNTQ